jgi:hypothetical protein
MKIKYVVISEMFPILFSEAQKHSDFLAMGNITSAGFVDIQDPKNPVTYGKSTSLKLKPDPCDEILIEVMLKND